MNNKHEAGFGENLEPDKDKLWEELMRTELATKLEELRRSSESLTEGEETLLKYEDCVKDLEKFTETKNLIENLQQLRTIGELFPDLAIDQMYRDTKFDLILATYQQEIALSRLESEDEAEEREDDTTVGQRVSNHYKADLLNVIRELVAELDSELQGYRKSELKWQEHIENDKAVEAIDQSLRQSDPDLNTVPFATYYLMQRFRKTLHELLLGYAEK